jgi:mono/diheme cytochrome c family protein
MRARAQSETVWSFLPGIGMSFPLRACLMAAVLLAAGCAPHDPRAQAVLALKGDPARGRILYQALCVRCHHSEGWPLVRRLYGASGIVSTVIDGAGKGRMPAFASRSDRELADLQAYVGTLK